MKKRNWTTNGLASEFRRRNVDMDVKDINIQDWVALAQYKRQLEESKNIIMVNEV